MAWRVFAALRCIGYGQDATRVGGLWLALIEGAATHVHSCRPDSQGSLFKVDVRPALPGDLAAPQAGKGEVPCVSIAVIGDAA